MSEGPKIMEIRHEADIPLNMLYVYDRKQKNKPEILKEQ